MGGKAAVSDPIDFITSIRGGSTELAFGLVG
jgi:hypothetical protein